MTYSDVHSYTGNILSTLLLADTFPDPQTYWCHTYNSVAPRSFVRRPISPGVLSQPLCRFHSTRTRWATDHTTDLSLIQRGRYRKRKEAELSSARTINLIDRLKAETSSTPHSYKFVAYVLWILSKWSLWDLASLWIQDFQNRPDERRDRYRLHQSHLPRLRGYSWVNNKLITFK